MSKKAKKSKEPPLKKQLETVLAEKLCLRNGINELIDMILENIFWREKFAEYFRNDSEFIDSIRADLKNEIREEVKDDIIRQIN